MKLNRKSSRTIWLLIAMLAVVGLALSGNSGKWQSVQAQSNGYTVQNRIVHDAQGNPIQLRGVSWFGFETQDHVPHGLWARNWKSMIQQMKSLGFNAIRLPVCPATLHAGGVATINYSLNPDLAGKNSLQILDMFMAELDAQGFYILVDHHTPDCSSISSLWYTGSYSEQQWIDDLVLMAERYAHLPHFFAIDLKNEPHGAATWGTGNTATDWNSAAERAGTAILAANPSLVIFVEGIQENPSCSGTISHWWGGNIEPLACTPVALPTTKVVYSPHVYGPDVSGQSYFNDSTFPANMPAIWEQHFGRFAGDYAVIIGEFGGRYGHGGDPKDRIWQDELVDYLISKNLRSAFYWSWNANSGDTGGILQDDWTNVWDDKVALLQRLWGDGTPVPTHTPGGPIATSTPTQTATQTPPATATQFTGDGVCQITYVVTNNWGHGFLADVTITNQSSSAWSEWNVTWTYGGNQQITNLWNGTVSQSGQAVQVTPAAWNSQVAAGANVTFGFQASYSGPNVIPTNLRVNGVDCNSTAPGLTNTPTATHTPAPTATPTATATPTLPPTATPTATPTSTGGNPAACQFTYRVDSDWGSGMVVTILLINQGTAAWNHWQASWSFGGNQQITNLWNGNVIQNGQLVTVQNAAWNAQVTPASTVSLGFTANYSGSNVAPTTLTVNGQSCTPGTTGQAAAVESPGIYLPLLER